MKLLRRVLTGALLFAVIVGGVWAITHRDQIYDWVRLHGYQPPTAITRLADDDTMTPYGRHLFYINRPDLTADKSYFNQQCGGKEQAIVLGCYHSNQLGIYLYAVNDPQLTGVEQVTAAHEMLHAAYDRLNATERNSVDSMLENYYQYSLHDQQIIDEINLYKQTEPNDVVNEMHSVFGTEIADLPAPLENYYKQYFTSRQKIAQYAANYQAAFTSREQQVSADDAQLGAMKKQIDGSQTELQQKQQALATQAAQLATEKSAGQIEAYNAGIAPYNNAIGAYNAGITALRSLISRYNTLVDRRNAIAIQENQLAQAINSQAPAAQPQ